MKEAVSREFTEGVFKKDKKYISIPKLLKEFYFDRNYVVENFISCKKACRNLMDYIVFSFEELDRILGSDYNFTSADWVRIFERESIPKWFLKKHVKKLEVKGNKMWHTKINNLMRRHQIPLDILEENIFIFGARLTFIYQRISKEFIIKHLPDLLAEVKSSGLQSSLTWFVWNSLTDKKSLNRDIIEDTFELYYDPEGRDKYNTIRLRGN